MPKIRPLRRIDVQPPVVRGGAVSSNATDDVLAPANPTVSAPYDLALTTAIGYSSASPTAVIDATWTKPLFSNPNNYQIQVSTNSTFTAAGTITALTAAGGVESAHIEGLLPGVLYYVRVRAYTPGLDSAWSVTVSITTATDTTAAGVPTSQAATWVGVGDLLITWVNPTDANFKDVKIVVRASAGGTILRTWYSAAQHWLYTLAMNFADTAGVGDGSLYVELQSRTFSDVLSSTVNTGLVTKSAPATPTGVTQSWSGDTGTAGADWTIAWTQADDAAFYRVSIDSVNHAIVASTYTYSFDLNKSEHSGTPDPSLAYSLTAVDGFKQASTAVSGTATNAAPAAPTATLSQGAVSGVLAEVTSTPPADFWRYEYVFKRDGSTVGTFLSHGGSYEYEMQGANDGGYHSWTVVVRQEDLFAQFSSTVTPAAVAFEGLTLSYLRDGIRYIDSLTTAPATLKSNFADGVTTSGGISYAA